MTESPKYVQRFARLPQVFEVLAAYPEGIAVGDLADRAGVDPGDLLDDLIWFSNAQSEVEMEIPGRHMLFVDFLSADGVDLEDFRETELVRLASHPGLEELGVEYVTAGELAMLYAVGLQQLDLDPADSDLKQALGALGRTMGGESMASETSHRRFHDAIDPIRRGAHEHRRVRIVYSRAWREGVTDRVIEPYRLVHTRIGGWEVDAGPVDEQGAMRTFLLANIRDAELLDETFELPGDLEGRLERQRETTRVRVRMPYESRWAAEHYAEKEHVVAEDEDSVTLDLDLLPPLVERVGKLVIAAGHAAEILAPDELSAAASEVAGMLLAHHSRTSH